VRLPLPASHDSPVLFHTSEVDWLSENNHCVV